MFGKNEIAGQKYFNEAPADKLFVTSIFYTLQGEGPLAGTPSVFVRLAKCNLACSFCDTFFDDGDWMSYDEILDAVTKRIDEFYSANGLPTPDWATNYRIHGFSRINLIVTGGEPSLQKNLTDFFWHCRNNEYFNNFQIESNGIVYLKDTPDDLVYVVSPKCVEKNGVATKYIKPHRDVMERANCLKFVVDANPDSPYHTVPEWAIESGKTIYVSPMNVYNDVPAASKEMRNNGANRIEMAERSTVDEVISFWTDGLLNMGENQKNHEYAAKLCMIHGFKLSLQTHLYASLA